MTIMKVYTSLIHIWTVTLPNMYESSIPQLVKVKNTPVCLQTVVLALQAVNLDVESNINISNNSRVAGISLTEGNTVNNTYTTESHTWDNNI